jgi:hypothetical protein
VASIFDIENKFVVHQVRTEADLQTALDATGDASKLHFIELVVARMDVPEALASFAKRAAAFDFPQEGLRPQSDTDVSQKTAPVETF